MDYHRMTMDYFHNKPILYYNVAYMELFSNLFENFLGQYSTTSSGKNLVNDIEFAKSITAIKKTLSKSIEFSNDTLQELIVLKGIHDAFFIRNIMQYTTFSKVQLFNVLDSIETKTKIAEHKIIAQNIRQKAKYLSTGTQAPNFTLSKNDKNEKSLDDYNGKYIYLNFCNTNSRECREDFEMLKLLDKKFKNLEIISISTDKNFAETQEFFKTMKYSWTLLDFNSDKQILEKYKVEVFPTYCLIDENKNIMMYPAYSPRENIELYLNKIYDKNKNIKINEYDELFKKPNSIKD
jgi:peroxiredoxin